MPLGTADLAFEGAGSATVAWATPNGTAGAYAGWTLFFAQTGSAETSCNADAHYASVALWVGGSASSQPEAIPAGVYHDDLECGSGVLCNSMAVTDDTIDFAEVDVIDADPSQIRGSLEGSATTGSDTTIELFGSFDAQVCAGG
ncbi:MAG TPA: hypothetical protein VGG28_14905 [Kofleriaceae bacterium]